MDLCDDDRTTVEDTIRNGFIGYARLSDEPLVNDFYQQFIEYLKDEHDDEYDYEDWEASNKKLYKRVKRQLDKIEFDKRFDDSVEETLDVHTG